MTDKPKKKLTINELVLKMEEQLSIAEIEGNHQKSMAIKKVINCLKNKKKQDRPK